MSRGVSNRWPDPPAGFLTTKGVIELGKQMQAEAKITYPFTAPQVLLFWINAPPDARRKNGFPTDENGMPFSKRHLRRGPGPRGGRYEWPEKMAKAIIKWWDKRLSAEEKPRYAQPNRPRNN